jgi:hypothetical protein
MLVWLSECWLKNTHPLHTPQPTRAARVSRTGSSTKRQEGGSAHLVTSAEGCMLPTDGRICWGGGERSDSPAAELGWIRALSWEAWLASTWGTQEGWACLIHAVPIHNTVIRIHILTEQ